MSDFITGAITMCSATIALFFLRFWRKTKDRLFALFSLSFGLMALIRLAHVVVRVPTEHVHYLYLARLLAYVLIIIAIVDKNRLGAQARHAKPRSDT